MSSLRAICHQYHFSHSPIYAFPASHWLEGFSNFSRHLVCSFRHPPSIVNSSLLQGHFHLTSLPSIWMWNIQVFWIIKTHTQLTLLEKDYIHFSWGFTSYNKLLVWWTIFILIMMSSNFPFCSYRQKKFNQDISLWAQKQLKCNSCRVLSNQENLELVASVIIIKDNLSL